MNTQLKQLNIEDILFFDISTVRQHEELTEKHPEFEVFRHKLRNSETDDLPTIKETIERYRTEAGGRMTFNKIASIGVGYVRNGKVYVKTLSGDEENILKEFFKITSMFKFLCGFNSLGYDLPMCYTNAAKYFDYTEMVSDSFVTSGKKPWELKSIIDLMDIMRGTHYVNISFAESLLHFGLSIKDDILPKDLSNIYYEEGVKRLNDRSKEYVFQTINLFRKVTFQQPFEEYTDKSDKDIEYSDDINLMSILYHNNALTDTVKTMIKNKLKGKKLTKKDKGVLKEVITSCYIRTEFGANESKSRTQEKINEVEEFIKTM